MCLVSEGIVMAVLSMLISEGSTKLLLSRLVQVYLEITLKSRTFIID
jgi:hypothetical protein